MCALGDVHQSSQDRVRNKEPGLSMALGRGFRLSWTWTEEMLAELGQDRGDVTGKGRENGGILGQGQCVKYLIFLGNAKWFCASGPTVTEQEQV